MKPELIHPAYKIHYFSLGKSKQAVTSFLCPPHFDSSHAAEWLMVEPGRLIIINYDEIEDSLRELIKNHGLPSLNEMTKSKERPRGLFTNRAFGSLRTLLYSDQDGEAPRAKPTLRKEVATHQ